MQATNSRLHVLVRIGAAEMPTHRRRVPRHARCVRSYSVPMKVSEILRLLEQDGWVLKRVTGSHRHYTHPGKPGLVTVAGKPSATLKPKTEASILKQAGLRRERP